jgi:hypothetical protein
MNLDMDINHYTDTELEAMFHLSPGYTVTQIVRAERVLYDKLMRSVGDFETQQNIALFLGQVTQRLSESQLPTPPPKPEIVEKWIRYMFTVDSMFRVAGSKINDFVYMFPDPVRIHSLQMEFLDIPVVWNEFQQALFYCNEVPVHIPNGTYTATEFEALLPTIATLQLKVHSHSTLSSADEFIVDFGKQYKSAGWIMGFRREVYKSEYNAITSMHEIVSEAPYGHLTELLYIEVYDYQENFTPERVYAGQTKHTMACVPLLNNQRIQIPYVFHRAYESPVYIDRLRIRLFNKVGECPLQTDFSILFSAEKQV